MAGNLVPRTDGGANLGTASKEWDALYVKRLAGTIARLIAPLANPNFTGVPTAPTAARGTSTTQLATTKFVVDEIVNAIKGTIIPEENGTADLGSASKEYDQIFAKRLGGTLANLVAMNDTSQRGIAYSVGDTVRMPGVPADMYLECTTPGITASTAPVISSPTVDGTVSDGTVVWTIRKAVNTSNLIMPIDVFFRQPSTAYAVGDIAYTPLLKSYQRLECVVGGTTSSGDLDVTSSTTGQYIQDGTVKWIVTDVRDGDMVGDISFHPTLLAGHIKANRASVNASDYPRLIVWVQDNGMLTTDSTDESKYLYDSETDVLTLPNVMDKVLQGGNAVEAKEAGLPNITGEFEATLTSNTILRTSSGAFSLRLPHATISGSVGSGTGYQYAQFDASRSNPIYGNSPTVQSPAITLIPQIRY